MAKLEQPKRRWYQFSLRTMLVGVTLMCVGLGVFSWWAQWSKEWIGQRQAVLSGGNEDIDFYSFAMRADISTPTAKAPISLRIFGERGISTIVLAEKSRVPKETAKRLFPEADIWTWKEWREPGTRKD